MEGYMGKMFKEALKFHKVEKIHFEHFDYVLNRNKMICSKFGSYVEWFLMAFIEISSIECMGHVLLI